MNLICHICNDQILLNDNLFASYLPPDDLLPDDSLRADSTGISPKPSTPSPSPTPTPAGKTLYSVSGGIGTYYYNNAVKNQCLAIGGGDGDPSCASYTPGPNQMSLSQLNTENVIAIGQLTNGPSLATRALYCGKQVIVTNATGQKVTPPNGGSFFVWDGWQQAH